MRRRLLALTTVIALVAGPLLAQAQGPDAYPAKPIRLIVPSPAGSPPDLVGRLIAEKLSAALGQPIVVDNRPGATGIIGLDAVAKSAPDGYTLGVIAMPHIVVESLVARMPYATEKDLAPVVLTNWNYQILAVSAGSPIQSVADLIAAAKSTPGGLKFSSGGSGTPLHLAGELFKRETGLEFVHVPYKGGPPAVLAVVAGDVDMTIAGVGIISPHIKGGRLRGLATAAPQRIAAYPELPTFVELGYPSVQIQDWQGLVAPARTPRSVIDRIYAEVAKATATPEVKTRLQTMGMEAASAGPEEFRAHIHREIERWRKVVRDAGIKAE
ncbi:MAG TPA: tripartite tricarboxylate transporter substrate binding protein [Xanthobacteraceae bacterium]